MKNKALILGLIFLGLVSAAPLQAEFLFAPSTPSANGFMVPTLNYGTGTVYEYSAWDVFYSPYSLPNMPDKFAPYGGHASGGGYAPETPVQANANPDVSKPVGGFAGNTIYNPDNPLAFWDTRNATITQTNASAGAFIIGPDATGNIYSFSGKTSFMLQNSPDYGTVGLGTVVLQFQTDGNTMDFSNIRLVYNDGTQNITIYAKDAEYLREYAASGGGHWSAAGGYTNRVAIQWDLSDLTDANGHPISSYKVYWEASSSSSSLQKVDLVTSDTYQAGIPQGATWSGGNGTWSNAANWSVNVNSGLSGAQENGNIKFLNSTAAVVTLDGNHTIGEMIFGSSQDVTLNPISAAMLTSNTGISTTAEATGTYTLNNNFQFGAINFFDLKAGTVVMNGILSGNYGLVKSGDGTLVLVNNNTFNGYVGMQGGTLRLEGNNSYTAGTTVINGRIVLAADAGLTGSLGSSNLNVMVGGDESIYRYTTGSSTWRGELIADGDRAISHGIDLAPGDLGKRIGAINTVNGAVFSGTINFTGEALDPDSEDGSAGNVLFTAQQATDRLEFSGAMTGGSATKTVTLDGAGTVVYSGVNKTYNNATSIASGTLVIQVGTAMTGGGAIGVAAGAKLQVNGGITGSGNLTVNQGTLRVNGTLGGTGALILNQGTLTGSGTVNRAIVADAGDVLSPGNSPGTMNTATQTWGGGATYLWEVGNLGAGEGAGWDLFKITGDLNVTADAGNKFVLQITSLDLLNDSGMLLGFDAASDYSWKIASVSGNLNGFSTDAFLLDASNFLNAPGGLFSISRTGNDLHLNYSAVPEPSTYLLLGLSGVIFWELFRRRRHAV